MAYIEGILLEQCMPYIGNALTEYNLEVQQWLVATGVLTVMHW